MEARYSLVSLFEQNKEELVKQLSGLDLLTETSKVQNIVSGYFKSIFDEDGIFMGTNLYNDSLISSLKTLGIFVNGAKTDEIFIDPKDAVFYEVSLSVDESYLVTGNIRHFPKNSKVITPADFIKIIEHK